MKFKKMIQLNIGGTVFTTSKTTLETQTSFLSSLINYKTLVDDTYFVDRDPTYFRYILNHLRGSKYLPNNPSILRELFEEADFYCLQDLQRNILSQLESCQHVGCIELELHLLRQKIDLMHN
jgi:hypothetical protein